MFPASRGSQTALFLFRLDQKRTGKNGSLDDLKRDSYKCHNQKFRLLL